ncbi:hypothetical protein BN903_4 [Halorubrum sp. AJ67]|nr:hypothetical protein BN903_4 [Halorubrum sp. AJ67]
MAVVTADAQSDSSTQVLRKEAFLSRESLYETEVVEALWREAKRNPKTGGLVSLRMC